MSTTTDPLTTATDDLTNKVADIIEDAAPGSLGTTIRFKDGELFDSSDYLDAPTIDGQTADKIKIAFAGSVEYSANDERGRKLFEDLALGKPVTLRVAGYVNKKSGSYSENAESETTVTGTAGIKVHTVYLLAPEQL